MWIHEGKTQVLQKNPSTICLVIVNEGLLEEMRIFIYLCRKMTTDSDFDHGMNARINNINQAFAILKPI